jgi:hypothetical protein
MTYAGREVEIIDAWVSSRGMVVLVRVTRGKPFAKWSHGGWVESATTTVPLALLNTNGKSNHV